VVKKQVGLTVGCMCDQACASIRPVGPPAGGEGVPVAPRVKEAAGGEDGHVEEVGEGPDQPLAGPCWTAAPQGPEEGGSGLRQGKHASEEGENMLSTHCPCSG